MRPPEIRGRFDEGKHAVPEFTVLESGVSSPFLVSRFLVTELLYNCQIMLDRSEETACEDIEKRKNVHNGIETAHLLTFDDQVGQCPAECPEHPHLSSMS